MSDMIYIVHGDHSIFARMDVPFSGKEFAEDYADFLRSRGYENVTIDVQENRRKKMIDNQIDDFTKEDTEFLYKIVEALVDEFGETLENEIKEKYFDTDKGMWDQYGGWFLDHLQKRLDRLMIEEKEE